MTISTSNNVNQNKCELYGSNRTDIINKVRTLVFRWYLSEKVDGYVETVAGQVLSTKRELWHLDGEKILVKKVGVSVKSVTEGERF